MPVFIFYIIVEVSKQADQQHLIICSFILSFKQSWKKNLLNVEMFLNLSDRFDRKYILLKWM